MTPKAMAGRIGFARQRICTALAVYKAIGLVRDGPNVSCLFKKNHFFLHV